MDGLGSGNRIGSFINSLIIITVIGLSYIIIDGGRYLYSRLKAIDTFKTSSKPTVTWELKTRGQTIDTVWIYTFKK